jgi:hypothetical protein
MNRSRTATLRRLLGLLVVAVASGSIASAASAAAVHFESPSGNINCFMFSTPSSTADCIVRTATWPNPPKKPSTCHLDWMPHEAALYGQKVTLGGCRGDVGPLCSTGSGHCKVLAYGHSFTVGNVRCSSFTAGVTCRRTVGAKAGFRIARQSVVVYH